MLKLAVLAFALALGGCVDDTEDVEVPVDTDGETEEQGEPGIEQDPDFISEPATCGGGAREKADGTCVPG